MLFISVDAIPSDDWLKENCCPPKTETELK